MIYRYQILSRYFFNIFTNKKGAKEIQQAELMQMSLEQAIKFAGLLSLN